MDDCPISNRIDFATAGFVVKSAGGAQKQVPNEAQVIQLAGAAFVILGRIADIRCNCEKQRDRLRMYSMPINLLGGFQFAVVAPATLSNLLRYQFARRLG